MDIDSLPSNSFKSKEKKEYSRPPKDLTPVVKGKTSVKKKTGIVKLADVFLPEDISSVKDYVINSVLIPKMKTMIHDTVSEAWDSFCGVSGRSTRVSGASRVSFTPYDKLSSSKSEDKAPALKTSSSRSYENIKFDNIADAQMVLDRMGELCEEFDAVSVNDMYSLAEVSTDNFQLARIGWTDIEGAKIVPVAGGGYEIKMPIAHPLD